MPAGLRYCILYKNKKAKVYVSEFEKSTRKIKLTHDKDKAITFSSRLKANHMSNQINTIFDIKTNVTTSNGEEVPLLKEYLQK